MERQTRTKNADQIISSSEFGARTLTTLQRFGWREGAFCYA